MFSHSLMSASREFQVHAAATEKRDKYVCEKRLAVEHGMSAEAEGLHGSVPARRDTLERLWSAPCESVEPLYG